MMDYLNELSKFIAEAKKSKNASTQPSPVETPKRGVEIQVCPMYMETSAEHIEKNPALERKIQDFLNFKVANITQPANKSDKVTKSHMPIGNAVPGMRKAHLTFDVSIWYTITGSNPTILRLYAVLTHDESGTGEPERIPIQRSVATQMSRQTFSTLNK